MPMQKPMRCEEGDDHRWDGMGFPCGGKIRGVTHFFSFLLLELQENRSQLLTRQYQYEYPYPIPSRDNKKTPSLPSVCFMHFLQRRAKIASATPYRVNLAAAELLAGLPRLPSLCSGHKYRQGMLIRGCLFLEHSRILKHGQSIGLTCSLIIRVDQCRDNIHESSAGSQESDMVGSLLCCHESCCFWLFSPPFTSSSYHWYFTLVMAF